MADVEFWSEDRRFGLRVSPQTLSQVLDWSSRSAPEETGGVLVGFYTEAHDCAVVTEASGAPPDSKSGRTFFVRGTLGLQRWLDKLWRKERYHYLGDWHFHPGTAPVPSLTDEAQIEEIARDESRKCPEPILLIVGTDAASVSNVRAYVFPRGGDLIQLSLDEGRYD